QEISIYPWQTYSILDHWHVCLYCRIICGWPFYIWNSARWQSVLVVWLFIDLPDCHFRARLADIDHFGNTATSDVGRILFHHDLYDDERIIYIHRQHASMGIHSHENDPCNLLH